ncbi:glycosyltransferase [Stieleria sp. TO1_6]|uniref:glycosyltransferase n=1 Tax=Stieleria tagensis TaxID=2956795 RepID=UPI00209B0F08|nr:glycosyltransferase [Stieleria tagensis]MCO8120673.1 glycosyltransferase [Stieleria tagensis]
MRIGILLTEFPNQTSVAMWRVAVAMRQLGNKVFLVSTRANSNPETFRDTFGADIDNVFNAWPPNVAASLIWMLARPIKSLRCWGYILSLHSETISGKLKLLAVMLGSASLARYCQRNRIQHLLVHSMANAAHLVSMAKLLGGCPFSLRLGGDLEVYGGDHKQKVRQASLIVAAAENNRQQVIAELGVDPARVIQSSLGVDTETFIPIVSDRDPQQPIRLVTVARLNKNKGHQYAIQAVRELTDRGVACHYTIVGQGPYRESIQTQIAELGLQDSITLAGVADQAAVIGQLQSADIFLLPSVGLGEATPVSVLEAMACGLPAIVSRIGGTPQMINDWVDGVLVDQADASQIADAVQRLEMDSPLYSSVAMAARQKAVDTYDCKQVAATLLASIKSIGHDGE